MKLVVGVRVSTEDSYFVLDGGLDLPMERETSLEVGCWTFYFWFYTVSEKRPHLTCYNLDIHDLITIIFGRSVTKKVRNQIVLCFATTYLVVLHYLVKQETQKLRLFT